MTNQEIEEFLIRRAIGDSRLIDDVGSPYPRRRKTPTEEQLEYREKRKEYMKNWRAGEVGEGAKQTNGIGRAKKK